MTVWALGDSAPTIDPSAFVHPAATVIGNVTIGPEASIWPGAVLRGDAGAIVIGARTSIQDGSVLHTTDRYPTVVGAGCVVGHVVHLEGCTVEDGCLVGSGSILLHRVVVRSGAVVGAAALVPEGMEVPTGQMALGVPARLRPVAAGAPQAIIRGVEFYVGNARRYATGLRRVD